MIIHERAKSRPGNLTYWTVKFCNFIAFTAQFFDSYFIFFFVHMTLYSGFKEKRKAKLRSKVEAKTRSRWWRIFSQVKRRNTYILNINFHAYIIDKIRNRILWRNAGLCRSVMPVDKGLAHSVPTSQKQKILKTRVPAVCTGACRGYRYSTDRFSRL